MICFERDNWAKLPMNVVLSERVKQAGSIAFRAGQYERAIALYTEALPPTDSKPELKVNLLANRALCYLKLKEPEAALQDGAAAVRCLPEFGKGYYRMAQALVDMGKLAEARRNLSEVLRVSKSGKNADATKMLEELEGKADHAPAARPEGHGTGARAARRALIREDRAQRLTVDEVNAQLIARCEHFSVLHRPYDQLRMHHELHAKPDFVLCHNIDYSLLGQGLVLSLNNLKKEESLRKDATVLPCAARVWAMGVQVRTDPGVPVDMEPLEHLYWSPTARQIHMDEPFERQIIKPLTKPATALAFDFRASSPQIRREERFELEMSVVEDGHCNAIVFWYELHMGDAGFLTSAPSVAARPGHVQLRVGQALHFVTRKDVSRGEKLPLLASHNRTRIHFAHRDVPLPPPRRGLCVHSQLQVSLDGHFNRTFAAATRKAIFSYPAAKGVLVVHVGAGIGTLSVVAAGARPESPDHVVACEKSADLIGVAEACARHNQLGSRISFLQKDARNLVPHDELSRKADILLLECIDHTLIGDGVLHYVEHLRNGFAQPNCRLIPAAGVMKGMLVEMRTGELHGVDMTMADAYRWQKEVRPVDLRKEKYVQMTEVFDIFVFDFAEAKVEQQVEEMEIIISKDGIVSALVIWFDLILDEEIVASTSPFGAAERTLGLGQGLVYLQPAECRVKRGSTLPLVAATNGSELAFTIDEDKLTRKSEVHITGATRLDQRWEGARANLEDAWKKMLQGLVHNPKEFKLMQDAIMRLAAQPAAFGIDPVVGERGAVNFLAD
jgi:predicted RNA methylase